MQTTIKCRICGYDNQFYSLKCNKCNNYLREKVPNIDFWSTLWGLIIEPSETFQKIIFSEHKNFSLLFNILFCLKIFVLSIIFSNFFIKPTNHFEFSFIEYNLLFLLFLTILFVNIIILSIYYVNRYILKRANLQLRFRDHFAISYFANFPIIIGMVILLPIEVSTLGSTMFYWYPNPYFYKPIITIVFIALEVFFYFYNLIHNFIGYKILFKNRKIAIINIVVLQILYTIYILFGNSIIITIYKNFR